MQPSFGARTRARRRCPDWSVHTIRWLLSQPLGSRAECVPECWQVGTAWPCMAKRRKPGVNMFKLPFVQDAVRWTWVASGRLTRPQMFPSSLRVGHYAPMEEEVEEEEEDTGVVELEPEPMPKVASANAQMFLGATDAITQRERAPNPLYTAHLSPGSSGNSVQCEHSRPARDSSHPIYAACFPLDCSGKPRGNRRSERGGRRQVTGWPCPTKQGGWNFSTRSMYVNHAYIR